MWTEDYAVEVARTACVYDDDKKLALAVFALGLAGEAAEVAEAVYQDEHDSDTIVLADDAIFYELGDVLWYVTALAGVAGLRLADLLSGKPIPVERDDVALAACLMVSAGKVADYVKKVVGHGKDLSQDKLLTDLKVVVTAVKVMAEDRGSSLCEVARGNVRKLRARYPNGFTPAHAAHSCPVSESDGRSLRFARR